MFATLEDRIARALGILESDYKRITQQLAGRIRVLEDQIAILRTVVPPDVIHMGGVCRACGLSLADLHNRQGLPSHAARVRKVFNKLREQGWSIDRIARATGYTSRGVAANLQRCSKGSS